MSEVRVSAVSRFFATMRGQGFEVRELLPVRPDGMDEGPRSVRIAGCVTLEKALTLCEQLDSEHRAPGEWLSWWCNRFRSGRSPVAIEARGEVARLSFERHAFTLDSLEMMDR